MRKVLIFFIITLICNFKLTASTDDSYLLIDDIIYNSEDSMIRFPYFSSKTPGKVKVVNQINKKLQQILFYDDEIINKKNIFLLKKHLHVWNDSIQQSGITSLNYKYELHPNFIQIIIDIDWAGGPYPVSAQTDYLYFDLEKGDLILMPDLIDSNKYFDFLEKFWLNECGTSIKEMHQCAYGNETNDYNSDKAYTLEGECEFQCHKMNHKFFLTKDSIFISNNSNCYPHVWQNCNYPSEKYLRINDIKDYLSEYGKWLIGLKGSYSNIKRCFHFVGKIDAKYKISMTIHEDDNNEYLGFYFYWSHHKKILLKGQLKRDSEQLLINEFVNNINTGSFELEWKDILYSTVGFWYNSSDHKNLPVNLLNIYDYSNKEYHR